MFCTKNSWWQWWITDYHSWIHNYLNMKPNKFRWTHDAFIHGGIMNSWGNTHSFIYPIYKDSTPDKCEDVVTAVITSVFTSTKSQRQNTKANTMKNRSVKHQDFIRSKTKRSNIRNISTCVPFIQHHLNQCVQPVPPAPSQTELSPQTSPHNSPSPGHSPGHSTGHSTGHSQGHSPGHSQGHSTGHSGGYSSSCS